MRQTQPAAYLKVLALLVPREHKVEHSNVIKSLSDQELEAMIEYLKTSLEAQAGGSIRVIEGTIEPISVEVQRGPLLDSPKPKNRVMLEADTAVGPREAQAGGSIRVIEGTIEPAAATAHAPKPKNRLMLEADTAVGPRERIPRKMRPPAGE